MTKMMKKWISTFVLSSLLLVGFASDFKYTSSVQTNFPAGYQQVDLSPEILGRVNLRFSDLRLLDSAQIEVPYILRTEQLVSMYSFFKEYPIIINKPQPNGTSVIVFENPTQEELTQINFVVKNNAVNKSARLSGSTDQKNWFLIRDHIHLHSMQNNQKTSELKVLNFPRTDYSYFKLEVNDSNSLPIQFEKVGYYDYQSIDGLMSTSPMRVISQKDSNQVSRIHLKFDQKTRINRIRVHVTGAEYYYRHIDFQVKKTRTSRKGKTQEYFESIGSGYLNSNSENIFEFQNYNLQDIYVKVRNGDDQPLQLEKVESYLLKSYLVAQLDPKMPYQLAFGNDEKQIPQYDIRHFAKDIPTQIPTLISGPIINHSNTVTVSESIGILDNKWVIWTAIGVVGIVLAFISFSMIKEMNQKEEG